MKFLAWLMVLVLPLHAEEPQHVTWMQAPEVLAGKIALVELDNRVRVQGVWRSSTKDTFTIDVEKSSDRTIVRKGVQTLARSSVRSIHARKRRVRGRILGVVAGFYGAAGLAAASTRSAEGLQGAWGLVAIASAVGGFFVGRASDQSAQQLVIVPDILQPENN